MHELERCHDAWPRSCCATCLNVFPQLPWKVTIHCLSWWNKFLMQDAFNGIPRPKKKALNLSSFLWSPWSWSLPLRRLLLHLRVVPKHPRFINSNEVGAEVGIVFGLFLELSADSNALFILIITYIFLLLYVLFVLCHYVYCLCVKVHCTTAIGWQPNCSLTNISYHIYIHTYHFVGPQILSYNSWTWNLSEKTHNTLLISFAQILLQCTACWAHPTKFAGMFHITAQQCCKCWESSVFSLLGQPLTLKPHFWVWFWLKAVRNWLTSIRSSNT